MVAIKAHFDGKVIVPDEPVDLPVGQRLIVQLAPPESEVDNGGDLFDLLREIAGKGDMPEDWAAEHDHYLYGTQKRSERGGTNPENGGNR